MQVHSCVNRFQVRILTEQQPKQTSIAGSAAAVGVAVMCSRILGLVREQVFAGLFGAGYIYDAFVVAFRIPNLLRDLFGEGALSAAFVTVFSAYNTNKNQEETWRLARNVTTVIALLLTAISLIGMIFTGPLVHLLAPDFSLVPGKSALTENLTRVMLPFLIFISLSAVVMGMLNTKGRFFIPALASSFFNLGSIVGGVSLAFVLPIFGYAPIVGMAFGTLIGGFLQLAIQLPSLYRTGFRYRFIVDLKDPGLHKIFKLMVPATIGLSATQINIFINTNFAASCSEGSVSWLYYAFRLVQLPIGIFGVALAIATLPVLARQAANKEILAMKNTLGSSLSMVFALTVPATAGLIILAEPIIRLIFEHGAFTAADTVATAETLSLYALGLFAYSANKIIVPAFYALEKTRYPVIASFLAIICNIIIIKLTIAHFQHLSIALSTSCTMFLNFLFLMIVLYITMGGFPVRSLLIAIGKILAATAVLAIGLRWGIGLCTPWLKGNLGQQAMALFALIFTAIPLYTLLLTVFRLSELTDLIQQIRARFRRSKNAA